jgi:hypothetical protein
MRTMTFRPRRLMVTVCDWADAPCFGSASSGGWFRLTPLTGWLRLRFLRSPGLPGRIGIPTVRCRLLWCSPVHDFRIAAPLGLCAPVDAGLCLLLYLITTPSAFRTMYCSTDIPFSHILTTWSVLWRQHGLCTRTKGRLWPRPWGLTCSLDVTDMLRMYFWWRLITSGLFYTTFHGLRQNLVQPRWIHARSICNHNTSRSRVIEASF